MPLELLQCIVHEPAPSLPPSQFSLPLVDFVGQCLTRDTAARPSPVDLLQHPLFQAYCVFENGDMDMRAWVQHVMAPRRVHNG